MSIFIHWAVWADTLGMALVGVGAAVMSCPLIASLVYCTSYHYSLFSTPTHLSLLEASLVLHRHRFKKPLQNCNKST